MRPRLVVVGDTLLDRDVSGRVDRVCPDAPVPVIEPQQVVDRPGGAGLAAALASSLAEHVILVTALASDASARLLRDRLAVWGVEVVPIAATPRTRVNTRFLSGGQSLLRADVHVGDWRLEPGAAVDAVAVEIALGRADAVLVADYGGGLVADPAVRAALRRRTGQAPVVWDPHRRGPPPVEGTTIATPSADDATAILAREGLDAGSGPEAAAACLQDIWPGTAVLVTDGAHGARLVLADGTAEHLPAEAVAHCDPCGAGDRLAAGVAVALGQRASLCAAARTGVTAASHWLREGGLDACAEPPGPRLRDADVLVTTDD